MGPNKGGKPTKLLLFLAASLIVYSSVEVWFSWSPRSASARSAWCDAWLCPEEFLEQRTFALIQQSADHSNSKALQELQRALSLDSASPYNWANLGDAEMNARHVDLARYCFQQAVAGAPLNPYILFRAANFDFQAGDPIGTLQLLRIVLNDPGLASYYEPTFLTFSRLDMPVEKVLEVGVPKAPEVAAAFLRYWMEGNKLSETEATWAWISHNGLTTNPLASDYVSFLLRNKELEAAAITWKMYTSKVVPEYRKTNWIYNGEFAREPTSSPLDWAIQPANGLEISRTPTGRNGQCALQMKFFGTENIDFQNVSQTFVLESGRWTLRAWVRTENITTDQGLVVKLFDTQDAGKLYWRSENMVGSIDWKCIEQTFEVGRGAKLLTLRFTRQPSRKFDNRIAGVVYVSGVTIQPAQTKKEGSGE